MPESQQHLPASVKAAILVLSALGLATLACWASLPVAAGIVCDVVPIDLRSGCITRGTTLLKMFRGVAVAFAFLPVILLFERWRPVIRRQDLLTPGLLVDGLWCLVLPLLSLLTFHQVAAALKTHATPHLATFKLGLIGALPLPAQLITVILLSDLLDWAGHVAMHKVPVLWRFHQVHHAQQQLNCMTTFRIHPGELLAIPLLRFLPFTLLGLKIALPAYGTWLVLRPLIEMFNHGNIRVRLGPLRHLLVTPQSHRVHHSNLPEHVDRNFGNTFALWDRLFRTQCLDYDVYPPTGTSGAPSLSGRASTFPKALRMITHELRFPFQARRQLA